MGPFQVQSGDEQQKNDGQGCKQAVVFTAPGQVIAAVFKIDKRLHDIHANTSL